MRLFLNEIDKVFILISLFCLPFAEARSQIANDSRWTDIKIINGTSHVRVYNFKLHYCVADDSSWVVSRWNNRNEFLSPGDTASSSIQAPIIQSYSYEYDCEYEKHHIVHIKIDTSITFKPGHQNLLVISYPASQADNNKSFELLVLLCAFLVGLIPIYFLIKYVTKKPLLRQKHKLEQELALEKERIRISAEMHDDIGSGLLAARLQTEVLMKKTSEAERKTDIMNITDAIHEISIKVHEAIWSIDPKNDTLRDLLSFVNQQAIKFLENSSVKLTLKPHDYIPDIQVNGEFRRNVYMVVKEALHNVLKHSRASTVRITCGIKDNWLWVEVKDNGKGFKNFGQDLYGMGINNMRRRAESLGGNIEIHTSPVGSTIELTLPLTSK